MDYNREWLNCLSDLCLKMIKVVRFAGSHDHIETLPAASIAFASLAQFITMVDVSFSFHDLMPANYFLFFFFQVFTTSSIK
jgi:hypothetical protein